MAECKNRWDFLNRNLKVVMEDIEAMPSISKLSECEGDFLQARFHS
jgi:hypothetical protein